MVLNSLGNPKPVTVSGYTSDFFGKSRQYWLDNGKPENYADIFGVDDFAAAFIRLETGTVIDFKIAWAMNLDTSGDTIFYGTKASLRVPSTECWNGSIGGPLKIYENIAGEPVCTEIPMKQPTAEGNFYHKIRSFLDAIKDNEPSPVPTSQIIYNQAILDGINKSNALGKEIEIVIPQI